LKYRGGGPAELRDARPATGCRTPASTRSAASAHVGRACRSSAPFARPALGNAAAGLVVARHGRLLGVAGFTVRHGKIVDINLLMDPGRLRELDLTALAD
jgi:hypothetical protein